MIFKHISDLKNERGAPKVKRDSSLLLPLNIKIVFKAFINTQSFRYNLEAV